MKFKTVGNPDKPKALLIHAMAVDEKSFSGLVEYLKDDYFIVMPILDGHNDDDNLDYISTDDEADKILAYLNENNIDKLDFILGTSLGAIIAFEVYKRNKVDVRKVFLDGGPFFHFGLLVRSFMSIMFWRMCKKVQRYPEKAAEKMSKLFPGLGDMMCAKLCHMSKKSMKNLSYACYTFSLPDLDDAAQKKITFLYGSKESALKCVHRLKKYKYSRIMKIDGFNHCEYLLSSPKEYAQMLREK